MQVGQLVFRLLLFLIKKPVLLAETKREVILSVPLPDGLYFIQVISEGKVVAMEKFVKQ